MIKHNVCRTQGSKVLVHCKMGVSRSASVVIAYAMKAYNWDFKKALEFVQQKRNCIKPNQNFISQLETYQVSPAHECKINCKNLYTLLWNYVKVIWHEKS